MGGRTLLCVVLCVGLAHAQIVTELLGQKPLACAQVDGPARTRPAAATSENVCSDGLGNEDGATVYLPAQGSANNPATITAGTFTIDIPLTNPPAAATLNTAQGTLCLGGAGSTSCACAAGVATAALASQNTTHARFTLPTVGATAWNTDADMALDQRRPLCWTLPGSGNLFTGFYVRVAWDCDDARPATEGCAQLASVNFAGRSAAEKAVMVAGRTACCKSSIGLTVGVCINANIQGCCNGNPFELTTRKCCSTSTKAITFINSRCQCYRATAATDCPNSARSCCHNNKYGAYGTVGGATTFLPDNANALVPGTCFNPSVEQCCDTGAAFNPGQQQCCPINGLQSLDIPCPCEADGDCNFNSQDRNAKLLPDNTNKICCKQTAPVPREGSGSCNKFLNYPSGTGVASTARCSGVCIDTTYQICCNGASCRTEFEKCCNSTCCNKFVGTCSEAFRPGAVRNPFNGLNYDQRFDQCTTVESLNPIRAFWVFVLPAALLTATVFVLALTLIFANKASARNFSLEEKAILVLALGMALLACPIFFSPAYKYGVVVVVVAVIAIVAASITHKWLNVAALVFVAILVLYLIDPFFGNGLLMLPSLRTNLGVNGLPTNLQTNLADHQSSGILHATDKMWHDGTLGAAPAGRFPEFSNFAIAGQGAGAYCTTFYDYFRMDPLLADTMRIDNPFESTFGFCARNWTFALLLIEGFIIIAALLLLVLLALALLLRFRKMRYEPVELEVRAEPPVATNFGYPVY